MNKLSLASTGNIQFTDQSIDFKQTGDFGLLLEGMQAKLQTDTQRSAADCLCLRTRSRWNLDNPPSFIGD